MKPPPAAPADQPEASDILALRWLAKGHDQIAFLTTRPVECARPIGDPKLAMQRDLGRAAFESPALLGGAAARRGVSCAACHINGRGNPDFFIEGLTGDPGTADVTSNIFSKTRGDGVFNPKVIPDLAAKDGNQIKDRASPEFRAKVHGLIVEEFNGEEPPPAVFEDLRIYLDSLELAACANPSAREPISVMRDLDSIQTALAAARSASSPAETEFWIRVARRRLERIDERYLGPKLADARARIEALSLNLGAEQDAIHAGRRPTPPITAESWAMLEAAVKDGEPKSLYDAQVLRVQLAASDRPPGAR